MEVVWVVQGGPLGLFVEDKATEEAMVRRLMTCLNSAPRER